MYRGGVGAPARCSRGVNKAPLLNSRPPPACVSPDLREADGAHGRHRTDAGFGVEMGAAPPMGISRAPALSQTQPWAPAARTAHKTRPTPAPRRGPACQRPDRAQVLTRRTSGRQVPLLPSRCRGRILTRHPPTYLRGPAALRVVGGQHQQAAAPETRGPPSQAPQPQKLPQARPGHLTQRPLAPGLSLSRTGLCAVLAGRPQAQAHPAGPQRPCPRPEWTTFTEAEGLPSGPATKGHRGT